MPCNFKARTNQDCLCFKFQVENTQEELQRLDSENKMCKTTVLKDTLGVDRHIDGIG